VKLLPEDFILKRRLISDPILMLIGVTLLILSGYLLLPSRPSRPQVLTVTAGDGEGLRHRMANDFARELRQTGLILNVKPTSGSEEAIEQLNAGEFDLAFVQGGLAGVPGDHVRQLTALHVEPLHLLVNEMLFAEIENVGLGALEGRRINVGSVGSGTHELSMEVLRFIGLHPMIEGERLGYVPEALSYDELRKSEPELLPDAIFTVSSLPSPIAGFMIEQRGYRLVPLTFGEALSLQAINELGDSQSRTIDKRLLFRTIIPNHTYSVRRAEPPEPLVTLGTRVLLVAHERVGDDIVQRVLDALFKSNIAQSQLEPLVPSLLDLPPEFPFHAGAEAFRQRSKPIIAGDAIDYFEKILAIAGTLAGGTFFVYRWYAGSRRRTREASLASYIARVIAIEREALENERAAELDLSKLIALQSELVEIKSEAVTKFVGGELQGEALIQGFLSLVNDAREQVTRLILHQREHIENVSQHKPQASGKLWEEQSSAGA
jgi:TRAP-type uncharacterized transport system substrate-binding protein